jgi:hypothetical protein
MIKIGSPPLVLSWAPHFSLVVDERTIALPIAPWLPLVRVLRTDRRTGQERKRLIFAEIHGDGHSNTTVRTIPLTAVLLRGVTLHGDSAWDHPPHKREIPSVVQRSPDPPSSDPGWPATRSFQLPRNDPSPCVKPSQSSSDRPSCRLRPFPALSVSEKSTPEAPLSGTIDVANRTHPALPVSSQLFPP